tara:strand:- start:761 stop:2074 length:1314 start_codon:yes stop_codon:yes gene_type:complete
MKAFVLIAISICYSQNYTLDQAVDIALQNKEALKASALDLRSSKQDVKSSYSGILPFVRVTGGVTESQFPRQSVGFNQSSGEILSDVSSITSASSNVTVNQTIYDGGVWWNNIRLAKNNYKVSEEFNRQIKTNIIRNVHFAYFNYLKAMQLLGVARSNLMSSQQQLTLVQQQFDLGSAKKTDLLKAEVRFGQARVDVISNDASVKSAYRDLKNSMGVARINDDFTISEVEKPLEIIPEFETGFELLQKFNPSVKAKQYQIVTAKLSTKIAKGSRMPNISISASAFGTAESLSEAVSNSYGDNQRTNTSLSISLPLYSGNTISARIQKAKIAVNKQESEYLTQLEDLSVQLKDLIDQLQNFNEIIPINETVLESAEEDLKLSQVRYSQGSTTILEVLNAQVSVVQAKSSLVRSKYDAFIQQANLKALLGTLDNEQKNN